MLMGCAQGLVDPQRSHSSQISTVTPAPTDVQPSFPIRAAFYYPWFPEAWNQQGFNPFTKYHPALGFYDSSSTAVIQSHISSTFPVHWIASMTTGRLRYLATGMVVSFGL